MAKMPSEQVLNWAAEAVGAGASVVAMKSLNRDSGPWLLRVEQGGSAREVVLRVGGRITPWQMAANAAALRLAEEHVLPAPRLLASDLDGRATGVALTLETAVPGTSAIPTSVSAERLRTAGAAIARVHKVRLAPQRDLPFRFHSTHHPKRPFERPLVRRWATLYRAAAARERPAVVQALCELTGWPADRARAEMSGTYSTPLLLLADDKVRSCHLMSGPQRETVLVHGDLWAGNMLWRGDASVTLIDWKDAGAGDPGVDLGRLRMKMAVQYGADAPAQVLDGWQRESGRAATHLAYWDVVAALNSPTDLAGSEPGFDDQGNQVTSSTVTERRDAFLREALDRLDRE